jgi:two-component system chemotaxis response regulator CheB
MSKTEYEAIAIGVSAGGLKALTGLFSGLSSKFPLPIIVTQHLHPSEESSLVGLLRREIHLNVKEADDKEELRPGCIYIAPPNYHLLIERNRTISLSSDDKVNYSRPSIDVMFESAALAWHSQLIGIILTGASSDGSAGIETIKKMGGMTIAEDPLSAEFPVMPQFAINTGAIDKILSLEKINKFLISLSYAKK